MVTDHELIIHNSVMHGTQCYVWPISPKHSLQLPIPALMNLAINTWTRLQTLLLSENTWTRLQTLLISEKKYSLTRKYSSVSQNFVPLIISLMNIILYSYSLCKAESPVTVAAPAVTTSFLLRCFISWTLTANMRFTAENIPRRMKRLTLILVLKWISQPITGILRIETADSHWKYKLQLHLQTVCHFW